MPGWSCVPAVTGVAAAHDEALSLGTRSLNLADDIESAAIFHLYKDLVG